MSTCQRWKRIITVSIVMIFLSFCFIALTNAESLEFYQLDFNLDGTITPNSDWGMVDLTYTGSTDICILI